MHLRSSSTSLLRLRSDKDIYFYINSPERSYNILDYLCHRYYELYKPDVVTICIGQAASMGAFLLSSGAKGKRYALPHSRIMIHQPSGGAQGQSTDIQIQAKEIQRLKDILNEIMAQNCGKSPEEIERDTERDKFMSAKEALEYGLIDKVLTKSFA